MLVRIVDRWWCAIILLRSLITAQINVASPGEGHPCSPEPRGPERVFHLPARPDKMDRFSPLPRLD